MFFNGQKREGKLWKMLHFIEHLNVRGEMRCNREDPDAVYNIIQGGVLSARYDPTAVTASSRILCENALCTSACTASLIRYSGDYRLCYRLL